MVGATRFLFARIAGEKIHIFLAEDDSQVCKAFKQEFSSADEITETQFISLFKDSQDFALCLIDSELLIDYATGTADEWLETHDIDNDLAANKCIAIYSGNPGNNSKIAFRWYVKSHKRWREDFSIIRELAVKTARGEKSFHKWPNQLRLINEQLSYVIHAIHNLMVPIELDTQTLSSLLDPEKEEQWLEGIDKEGAKQITVDIFGQYFGPGDSSYLGAQSKIHKGMGIDEGNDIVSYVEKVLELLPHEVCDEVKDKGPFLGEEVDKARQLCSGISLSPITPASVKQLRDALNLVNSVGESVLTSLRDIRAREEREPK
jgi:hypothetical protein